MVKKLFISLLMIVMLVGVIFPAQSHGAEGIEIYTPYTGITVTPGETITYSYEILNHTSSIQQVSFRLEELAKDWQYTITSNEWNLQELSIKPGESQSITVELTVPLQVDKGAYDFIAAASSNSGEEAELPMTVTVSEEGTFKTEFTTEQPNLEGSADSTFDYTTELKNRTAEEQHYALLAEVPRGWNVDFKADGDSVTSVTVESNGTKQISVSVTPPTNVKEGTYEIPIKVSNDATSASLTLEAAITGSYGIELTTPSGKLSETITAGDDKVIDLVIKNTGTAPLTDISLNSTKPEDWEVTFDSGKLSKIEPGKSENVQATIKASDNAIAGDYVVEITANAPEASSNAQFRMSVKTSTLWGWFGVIIIIAVAGGIYYLIRKYGRR